MEEEFTEEDEFSFVDLVKELDKFTVAKPLMNNHRNCPTCGKSISGILEHYCTYCGQLIDK